MKLSIKDLNAAIQAARELKTILDANPRPNHMLSAVGLRDRLPQVAQDSGACVRLSLAVKRLNDLADQIEGATVSVT